MKKYFKYRFSMHYSFRKSNNQIGWSEYIS